MKTNFLKTLCLVAFLFMSNMSFGQTKEETISWLQDKLQKYIFLNCDGCKAKDIIVKVDVCFISINFSTIYLADNKKSNEKSYLIPTKDLLVNSGNLSTKDKIRSIKFTNSDGEVNYEYFTIFTIPVVEENLYQRLQKAIDHLATFCPKKTETF